MWEDTTNGITDCTKESDTKCRDYFTTTTAGAKRSTKQSLQSICALSRTLFSTIEVSLFIVSYTLEKD
jgi:hypothetical protein